MEIKEIRKTVIIDSCKAVLGRVIIDGRLRKDINYKTLEAGRVPPEPGVFLGCSGVVNTASGDVVHTTVDIAFSMMVAINGARPNDTCVVLDALAEGEAEDPINPTVAGTFTGLVDKTVVRVRAKVVRPATINVPDGAVEEAPTVVPGPRPGTFLGPTVAFGGPIATRGAGVVPPEPPPTPPRPGGLFGGL